MKMLHVKDHALSHYGVYLQELSAYNAKITQERLQGPGTAKPGSGQEKAKTVAKSKEELKRTNDKRKGKALTEQQKVKQRDYYKKWYERNKDKLKGRIIVLTEEQKVKQRAYYKQWYQRNKGKRKLTERQSE
ncbi:unnamed protein product [Orchesella dallaii]|uniref:Uncharacterized protein n=1 Tax=Orchesella dallaii TaxID=48710 RepID=A0ABP1R886_9HEXA